MKVLVTGGSGFIGSNFLRMFVPEYPDFTFINFDQLTYAANPLNLKDINDFNNYSFVKGDISNYNQVEEVFGLYRPDSVIHFAAESHVDRSITGPAAFIDTNIIGTFNLLEACRRYWTNRKENLFHHVSTDEVYGSLGETGQFSEESRYDPSSPYSASKAASDHLVRSYYRTYGLPVKITNCSNNYGPYQFPEKLIPLIILKALEGQSLPLYGKGENVRDWLFVEDHCNAIWVVVHKGNYGETYNIGGNNEWRNIDVVSLVCEILADLTGKEIDEYKKLITFVKDRPGHDLRYAIDSTKITAELGWKPKESFYSGLRKTIQWYLDNKDWLELVKTGEYRKWTELNYNR